MASASSLRKGQIPVNCNLCDEDHRIQFKCKDCDMLLCRKCKEKRHIKFKNAADHRIIDIKDIGTADEAFRFSDVKCEDHKGHSCCMYCKTCNKLICLKCIPRIHYGHDFIDEETFINNTKKSVSKERKFVNPSVKKRTNVRRTAKPELTINRQFVSVLRNIHSMTFCTDGSLRLSDHKKHRIQHVRLRDNDIQILSNINTVVYGMEVTSSGDILLSVGDTSLKQISDNKSEIENTKYHTSPLVTRGIHITSDNQVIISARSQGPNFPVSGRRVLIVMDQEGNTIKEYEYDKTNTPLFTLPTRVISSTNGNICVVDRLDDTGKGRAVILSRGGNVISVYTGNKDINKDNTFSPRGIVTTQPGNIIITDLGNHALHIMNCNGRFITYFRLSDMGIKHPYALVVTASGRHYIGCVSYLRSPDTFRSKLYEMEYSGF